MLYSKYGHDPKEPERVHQPRAQQQRTGILPMSFPALMDEQTQLFPRAPVPQEPARVGVDIGPTGQHLGDRDMLHEIWRHSVATMMDGARALMQSHFGCHDVERGFGHARHRGTEQKLAIAAFGEPGIEVADLGKNRAMAEASGQEWNIVADIVEREPCHVPPDQPPHRHFAAVGKRAEDAGPAGPDPDVGPRRGGEQPDARVRRGKGDRRYAGTK